MADITYYPAELKLYGKADISSCTFVVRNGVDQQNFFVKTYIDKTEYKEKKIEKAIYEYLHHFTTFFQKNKSYRAF